MEEILELIEGRHSTRAPFAPDRPITKENIKKILEAARWAPTPHNMQNFEIVVVDDKKVLDELASIKSTVSEAFIRENFQQLSQTEEELRKKKVGIMGSGFPPAWRNTATLDAAVKEAKPSELRYTMKGSPLVMVVVYDSRKRSPASEGDTLGFLGLGCVMQNMWLVAQSLEIGFQIMSVFSGKEVSDNLKRTLKLPKYMEIGFAVRLGYPASKGEYLRVRRDVADLSHHNAFGNKGL